MLVKPILSSTYIMDASMDNTFSFTIIGGNQFTAFEYEIINNTTLALVAKERVQTSTPIVTISKGILVNGQEYRICLRTTDGTNYSEMSDYMIIKCYTKAVATIDNFTVEDGKNYVKNQSYIFEGSYYQAQNIKLKAFYYTIYNENGVKAQEYPMVYQTEGPLRQSVSILSNQTFYKIQLICIDQNDVRTSSGIIDFYVDYQPPRIRQLINLTNNSANASVDIDCDLRQLMFIPVGNVFFENDAVNVESVASYIYMDDSFTLNRDFFIQMWIDRCKEDEILYLEDTTNKFKSYIKVFYRADDKKFHALKVIGAIPMEYVSEEFDKSKPFSLYIKQEDGRIEIKPERLGG